MERMSKEILDSLSHGVLAVDLGNRILYLNPALARRLGITRDEWLGREAAELGGVLEPRLASAEEFRKRLNWQENAEESVSRELDLKEGENWVHLREDSEPLRESGGRVVGRLFSFYDISQAKLVDRMKTEFIAVASHELRTPMTSIKGSIDLILSGFAGEIGPDTHELLDIAQKGCDRLIRLINDILDLAKIEAGHMKLKPVPMDLSDVVERSIRSMKSLADQNRVKLRFHRPEALPEVDIDKDRMEQVVTNLLSNAIKFSPPDGEVRVELLDVEGSLECRVVDQGCGIAEADLPRVFGKFQQLGESRRKGGTGLGLAITQGLVHEHRGKIWVESNVNEGSRFILRLPIHSAGIPQKKSQIDN